MIAVILAVFASPLAYAQSSVFINKSKKNSAESSEKKKPSIFIRRGQQKKSVRKNRKKQPFVGKNTFRSDSRLSVYRGGTGFGKRLVMPNMDMSGSEAPTKEDLLMMVAANRQPDLEFIQKRSALLLQKAERDESLRERRRDQGKNGKERRVAKKVVTKKNALRQPDNKSKTTIIKKKRQVFVRKKSSNSSRPKRIFNSYD